jgi:hypothetical protein
MKRFFDNLKRQAEENPIAALAVTAVVLTAASRLLKTGVEIHNSNVWAKEVARRTMRDTLK